MILIRLNFIKIVYFIRIVYIRKYQIKVHVYLFQKLSNDIRSFGEKN